MLVKYWDLLEFNELMLVKYWDLLEFNELMLVKYWDLLEFRELMLVKYWDLLELQLRKLPAGRGSWAATAWPWSPAQGLCSGAAASLVSARAQAWPASMAIFAQQKPWTKNRQKWGETKKNEENFHDFPQYLGGARHCPLAKMGVWPTKIGIDSSFMVAKLANHNCYHNCRNCWIADGYIEQLVLGETEQSTHSTRLTYRKIWYDLDLLDLHDWIMKSNG